MNRILSYIFALRNCCLFLLVLFIYSCANDKKPTSKCFEELNFYIDNIKSIPNLCNIYGGEPNPSDIDVVFQLSGKKHLLDIVISNREKEGLYILENGIKKEYNREFEFSEAGFFKLGICNQKGSCTYKWVNVDFEKSNTSDKEISVDDFRKDYTPPSGYKVSQWDGKNPILLKIEEPITSTDRDQDGIPDKDDNCPDQSGPKSNQGCPIDNKKPTGITSTANISKYRDTDNDGIADDKDACPNKGVRGNVDNKGCPIKPVVSSKKPTPASKDTDKDGVIDKYDKCPNKGIRGKVDSNGCPNTIPKPVEKDSDGDGILDSRDKCKNAGVRGKITNDGCPDRDQDGIPDSSDSCPDKGIKGKIDNNGCPLPPPAPIDTDGDGVPDNIDKCNGEGAKGKVDKNGCAIKVMLSNRGLLRSAEENCIAEKTEWQANKFILKFTASAELELRNVMAYSESNWSASIRLIDSNNKTVGDQIREERLLTGATEINLTPIGYQLQKGKTYTLEIEGTGQLLNIASCVTEKANAQLTTSKNSNFYNIEYKY